ncbi:hypothetical protein BJX96DRAFT_18706 [Aspergillus floccosus]
MMQINLNYDPPEVVWIFFFFFDLLFSFSVFWCLAGARMVRDLLFVQHCFFLYFSLFDVSDKGFLVRSTRSKGWTTSNQRKASVERVIVEPIRGCGMA